MRAAFPPGLPRVRGWKQMNGERFACSYLPSCARSTLSVKRRGLCPSELSPLPFRVRRACLP